MVARGEWRGGAEAVGTTGNGCWKHGGGGRRGKREAVAQQSRHKASTLFNGEAVVEVRDGGHGMGWGRGKARALRRPVPRLS